jgi:hypothetical protein
MHAKVSGTVCFANLNEEKKVPNLKYVTQMPRKDKYKIRRTNAIECEHGKPSQFADPYPDLDDDSGHGPVPTCDNEEKY